MYTPKCMASGGWVSIDSKIFNDGMLERCSRNNDGDWVDDPDHDEIISKPNSKFNQLVSLIDKKVKKYYGLGAELDEFRSSYEDDDITELKVTFTYQRNGVLPL